MTLLRLISNLKKNKESLKETRTYFFSFKFNWLEIISNFLTTTKYDQIIKEMKFKKKIKEETYRNLLRKRNHKNKRKSVLEEKMDNVDCFLNNIFFSIFYIFIFIKITNFINLMIWKKLSTSSVYVMEYSNYTYYVIIIP